MSTRTRTSTQEQRPSLYDEEHLDLEAMSDQELEDMLFDEEKVESKGLFNLPTMAGLSLILVGVAYIFQQLGLWSGLDLRVLASMLPWLAGILIILLGFGVLGWRPGRRSRKDKRRERAVAKPAPVVGKASKRSGRGRLQKSADKKLAGVAGGLADYFGIDATLVRIAFVIGTIASQGTFLLGYIILSFVMPAPEKPSLEERITIIRDS